MISVVPTKKWVAAWAAAWIMPWIEVLGVPLLVILVLLLPAYGIGSAGIGISVLLVPTVLLVKNKKGIAIPKWVLIPIAILMVSALAHLAINPGKDGAIGLVIVALIPIAYLAGKKNGEAVRKLLVALMPVLSVAIMVHKAIDPTTVKPVGMVAHHIAAFVVLIGLVLTPKKWRIWAAVVAIPAVAMSGSEEGLVAMGILVLVWVLRVAAKMDMQEAEKGIIAAVLIAIALAAAMPMIKEAYPNLTMGRVAGAEELSNLRWSTYVEEIRGGGWVLGEGWSWEAGQSAIHNMPLMIASQYGVVAAIGIVAMVGIGTWRAIRRRRWQEVAVWAMLIWFGMIDHFLWTWLGLGAWMLMGLAAKEER